MPERRREDRMRDGPRHFSKEEMQERKTRILTMGTSAIIRSIADAIVIKDKDAFFLTEPDGSIPLEADHGFGLYYRDCRFLRGYKLKLAGIDPVPLVSTAERGFMAILQLTNPDIRLRDGFLLSEEEIGIRWDRVIDGGKAGLYDLLEFRNFSLESIELPISLAFQAAFEPIFVVRGLLPLHLGTLQPPEWKDGILKFAYDGADGLYRSLAIHLSPAPADKEGATAHFELTLRPQESKQIVVSLLMAESRDRKKVEPKGSFKPKIDRVRASLQRDADEWVGKYTNIHSDSILLNSIIDRSLRDLNMLRSGSTNGEFFAAGVPWFATLFGRDSIITAIQTLAYDPSIAEETLRLLARYQGEKSDEWRDEQPGKILHELRVDELARLGEIPHSPYYGTVDATPLFLILVGYHAAWTGNLTVFDDLRDNVERALDWMAWNSSRNGDGYIRYESNSTAGLINHGWKDSGDAIVNVDGSLATPPIALVEVQGYAYLAKILMADLYRRTGERQRADRLQLEAETLRSRLNRDFWLKDKGFYALALQAKNEPSAVISSNPGHILWSGIAQQDKAKRTVERLMAKDMHSGWGIRSLSEKERRYNPIGYHLGTVWPHDNSFIAAGFRRYGFDEEALRIFVGMIEAATRFEDYRLPELFAGFARKDYGVPVSYPVACHPQAWSAGSIPYLLQTALGLLPEAFDHRLRITRPVMPDFIRQLEVHHLRVGEALVDLHFERVRGGIAVQVLNLNGPLDVVVEPT